MSWVPRFPEVKAHLKLSNGDFGIILSTGSIGALLALVTIGHFVNQFGTRIFLLVSATGFCVSIAAIVNIRSEWLFLICNMAIGFFISVFNISINAQSLAAQSELQVLLLPKTAGSWSTGALCSILLNSFLVTRVSISVHIGIIQIFCLIGMYLEFVKILPHLVTPTLARKSIRMTLLKALRFRVNWLFAVVMLLAIQMEFSMGDWATIYAREELGSRPEYASLPYLVFLGFMILGRLNIHRFTHRYSTAQLLKIGALVGGGGYSIGLTLSHFFKGNLGLTYSSFLLALACSGLGSSFMAPLFVNAAQKRSAESDAVLIGQIGVLNISMVFVVKGLISGVAQLANLYIALLVPGFMLLAVVYFSTIMSRTGIDD